MREADGRKITAAGNGEEEAEAGSSGHDEQSLPQWRPKQEPPGTHRPAAPEESLVGESPAFLAAIEHLKSVADHDLPILLLGETGTGKEVVARAFHRLSRRRDRPFVSFNCAAGTVELFDNHLFGHKRGAYTGADHETQGLVGRAEQGTLQGWDHGVFDFGRGQEQESARAAMNRVGNVAA